LDALSSAATDLLAPGEVPTLDTMGAAALGGEEVLLSVWSGADLSVTLAAARDEAADGGWRCVRVETQGDELRAALELAGDYLARADDPRGPAAALRGQEPHAPAEEHVRELVLRPRRFSAPVLLAGLARLVAEYRRAEPAALARPDSASAPEAREYVRRAVEALLASEGGALAPGKVWRDLLASCVVEWRAAHDASVGVAAADAPPPPPRGGSGHPAARNPY